MNKSLGTLLLVLLIILFSGCALEEKNPFPEDPIEPENPVVTPTYAKEEEVTEIIVEIKGSVQRPGVYQMDSDARLYDLYQKAGGGTESSELRSVNLAMRIEDGQSFYIPFIGEEPFTPSSPVGGEDTKEKKINLNTATKEELMTVTGIGPSTADNILLYREEAGKFTSVDDLLQVNRIGEKTLDKIREFFTVK